MHKLPFLNDAIDGSTILLLIVLLFLGARFVERDAKLQVLGRHIAFGAFFLFIAMTASDRQPTDAEAWVAVLIRSLIFAGIVQGGVWMVLPAVVFAYRNTFGLALKGVKASMKTIERRASIRQAERERQSAATRERLFQEGEAIRLAQRKRENEVLQLQRMQEELARAKVEREQEFHQRREQTVGLFLTHHGLLKNEFSVAGILEAFEKWRSSLHDSWDEFLLFCRRLEYQILVGAARNNLVNDYSKAEPAIGTAFPRDQFLLLMNEALDRDGGNCNVDGCMQRLSSLHDKIVSLFQDRSPEWQATSDVSRADSYTNAFAETGNAPEGESPFDEDNRLTYQHDVG